MTKQSKSASLIEVLTSIFFGFIVSMIVQTLVIYLWQLPLNVTDNFIITCIFTVTSIIRGYIFRRIFEHLRVKGYLQ